MILAIIPARGGSKRIPGKNIKPFCGKPIIGYSIQAALSSGLFDQVIVSTDSPEVTEVAQEFGASVPFVRPAELSDDHTPTMPVIRHAIEHFDAEAKTEQDRVAFACCLYPTAPFVTKGDLAAGFSKLEQDGNADFCFSVTSFPFPIWRAIRMTDSERVEMFWPENQQKRSQDLEEAYHDAGQFYWGKGSAFFENEGFFGETSIPLVLPRHRVQDIDTMEDWHRAEQLFKASAEQ